MLQVLLLLCYNEYAHDFKGRRRPLVWEFSEAARNVRYSRALSSFEIAKVRFGMRRIWTKVLPTESTFSPSSVSLELKM
jgi:hypothetical protein